MNREVWWVGEQMKLVEIEDFATIIFQVILRYKHKIFILVHKIVVSNFRILYEIMDINNTDTKIIMNEVPH